MIEPALRAALTAVLSIGCMAKSGARSGRRRARECREAELYDEGDFPPSRVARGALAHEPSGQHRRGGARDEDDGARRPRARGAAPFPASRGRRPWPPARRTCSSARGWCPRSRRRSRTARSPSASARAAATSRTRRASGARPRRRRSRRRRTAPVALVFGNETSGLSQRGAARAASATPAFPANPDYASLNLAAAVQVACYELALAAAALPRSRRGARALAGHGRRPRGAARAAERAAGGERLPRSPRARALRRAHAPPRRPRSTSSARRWPSCTACSTPSRRAESELRCQTRCLAPCRTPSVASETAATMTAPREEGRLGACVSTSQPPTAMPAPSPLTMKVEDQVKASVA